MLTAKVKRNYKKWIFAFLVLIAASGIGAWYVFTEKFADTAKVNTDYSVDAMDLIQEFRTDLQAANSKYSEKILLVSGVVSEVKKADTSTNIIMADENTGAYIIFAFQEQHQKSAESVKEGDRISIKGSCSGGFYSDIMETENISFKRCAIDK